MATGKEVCMDAMFDPGSGLGADQLKSKAQEMVEALQQAKQHFRDAGFQQFDEAKEYTLLYAMANDVQEMSKYAREVDHFEQQLDKLEAEKRRLPSQRPEVGGYTVERYDADGDVYDVWVDDDSEGQKWERGMKRLDSGIMDCKRKKKEAEGRVKSLEMANRKSYKNAQDHTKTLEKKAEAEKVAEDRKWDEERDARKETAKKKRDEQRQKAEESRSGCVFAMQFCMCFGRNCALYGFMRAGVAKKCWLHL